MKAIRAASGALVIPFLRFKLPLELRRRDDRVVDFDLDFARLTYFVGNESRITVPVLHKPPKPS